MASSPAFAEGAQLRGPFWPEDIEVVKCRRVGNCLVFSGKGLRSRTFYENALSPDQLEQVEVITGTRTAFSADPEAFFLAAEALRIRFAHQFDPLYAVSVSQIDPLPHQIEAVYHHTLKTPRLRFLLAGDPGAGKGERDPVTVTFQF